MGYQHLDKSPARGKMYLLTRDEEPFCGKYISYVYNICIIYICMHVDVYMVSGNLVSKVKDKLKIVFKFFSTYI